MILYDFWAEWCGPCKMMNPIVDEIELDFPKLEIVRVNVDENPSLMAEYGVRSIPTYVLIDESGVETKRIIGALPKYKFLKELGL